MTALLYATAVLAALRGLWSPCGMSMLSSLNPVSERARGNRFWPTACWYLLGATVGGGLLGAGGAVLAFGVDRLDVPQPVLWALTLCAAAVAALSDARVGGRSLPLHPRQVDERWLTRYRRWIYAAGYGVQIGTGFATYIMTAAVYLVAALAALSGNPTSALTAGFLFGVVRGLGIGVAAYARDPERLRLLLARVDNLATASALAACATCVAVAVVAAWRLAGPASALGVALLLAVAARLGTRRAVAG